ncbi:MAG: SusD/RagB family nutrient-binding outer membrane lipoprotein [Ferruginibacter sp.]
MNLKRKLYGALGILSISILVGSCQKLEDFGDTNVNPNGSTTVNTGALLTSILANLGAQTSSLVPGLYAQYYAESTYPGTSLYADPNFSSAATYVGSLMDAQVIINANTDARKEASSANGDNNNQVQIAKILKAYQFSYITDRYGDIPYSEALGGVTVLQPKYDMQEDIYKSMITDLTTAANTMKTIGVGAIKGDIAYNGNISKWIKLANSLRMLFSLKLSERYPGPTEYAAVEFNKAATNVGGYIAINADNLQLTYPGGNIKNPYFALGQTLDNAVSTTFSSILVGLNDTRVAVFSANSGGVAYGLSSAAPANGARIFAPAYRQENSPFYFVTAAHVLLALAEARERGWTAGDAKTAYEAGIAASFAQWGLSVPAGYLTGAADFNTGTGVGSIGSSATVPGSSAATTNRLERIWLQQYIAWFPDGTQAWNNWRRTEFPKLKPTINATNSSKQIVRRYTYAPDEYSNNTSQLLIAIARMSGNSQDTHIWWDKN